MFQKNIKVGNYFLYLLRSALCNTDFGTATILTLENFLKQKIRSL